MINHTSLTSTQPSRHPTWCDPRVCTTDDPHDPLHGTEPVELGFDDCDVTLSLFSASTGTWVEITASSKNVAQRCECGRSEPLFFSTDLTGPEALDLVARITGLLALGGAA